jgi:signal transduction histidine kinase
MNNSHTLLIVDDDPIARDTLEALLFRENYDLVLIESGQQALARLDELDPDIILLDVMMPGMNGFEVCQHIKAHEQWRHIPVILITALDSPADMVQGFESGADDFLHKPVNVLELKARLRSMLRLKKQYDALQETLRLREQMSDMIIHDMRTPLASTLLLGTLLKRSLTDPKDLGRVEKILSATRRLKSFVDDLLLMAKTQEQQLVLNRTPVDVNQLVLAVKETHDAIAQSRGINLVADLPAESQETSLDENLFSRVLDNLVSNALKYSPAETTVTIRVEYVTTSSAPCTRVTVLDQGDGIGEGDCEKIFDQLQGAGLQEGDIQIGMGLTFCKMVVEAHQGRISARANTPTGCVFTVEI